MRGGIGFHLNFHLSGRRRGENHRFQWDLDRNRGFHHDRAGELALHAIHITIIGGPREFEFLTRQADSEMRLEPGWIFGQPDQQLIGHRVRSTLLRGAQPIRLAVRLIRCDVYRQVHNHGRIAGHFHRFWLRFGTLGDAVYPHGFQLGRLSHAIQRRGRELQSAARHHGVFLRGRFKRKARAKLDGVHQFAMLALGHRMMQRR